MTLDFLYLLDLDSTSRRVRGQTRPVILEQLNGPDSTDDQLQGFFELFHFRWGSLHESIRANHPVLVLCHLPLSWKVCAFQTLKSWWKICFTKPMIDWPGSSVGMGCAESWRLLVWHSPANPWNGALGWVHVLASDQSCHVKGCLRGWGLGTGWTTVARRGLGGPCAAGWSQDCEPVKYWRLVTWTTPAKPWKSVQPIHHPMVGQVASNLTQFEKHLFIKFQLLY